MDDSQPYLVGDVAYLPDADGTDVDRAAGRALAAFGAYRRRLGAVRGTRIEVAELPDDALMLSYALSAGGLFLLSDRQALLEDADAATRLNRLARLLRHDGAPEPAGHRAGPHRLVTQLTARLLSLGGAGPAGRGASRPRQSKTSRDVDRT